MNTVEETGGTSPERFCAFSDGVIAIAITLLILEIKVPKAELGQLGHELEQLWPSYIAFAVSFLTIGIMWVNHHNLSRRLVAVDHGLLYLNLALLGAISFIPFPTAVIAEYLREGGSNERSAAFLYSIAMIMVSAAFTSMWWHIARRPHLMHAAQRDAVRMHARKASMGIPIYVAVGALSLVSATAALIAFGVIAVAYAVNRSESTSGDH